MYTHSQMWILLCAFSWNHSQFTNNLKKKKILSGKKETSTRHVTEGEEAGKYWRHKCFKCWGITLFIANPVTLTVKEIYLSVLFLWYSFFSFFFFFEVLEFWHSNWRRLLPITCICFSKNGIEQKCQKNAKQLIRFTDCTKSHRYLFCLVWHKV